MTAARPCHAGAIPDARGDGGLVIRRRVGPDIGQRDDLRDGTVTIENDNRAAAPDVVEVFRQVILQLPDLGSFHMAKLATFDLVKSESENRDRAGPARRGAANLDGEAADGEAIRRQRFEVVQLRVYPSPICHASSSKAARSTSRATPRRRTCPGP